VSSEGPPAGVLAFIDQHIESIEQLEVLLFLHAQERARTTAEIFREIQSSQASVNIRLKQLEAAGLIIHEAIGQYRMNRSDEALQKTLDELSRCYRTMRVRIIEAIYTRRSDAVRSFADAFKLKKKE
jgi:predicted transcriptional regulator